MISLSGAVEVAPRLGLADAIVDLVSTGSTLAMNGLRADRRHPRLARPCSSPTPPPTEHGPDELDGDRDDARLGHRGPRAQVPDDERPGGEARRSWRTCSRASSRPSVIPLAHDGMIAIHSVVGADEVWALLPRLKAAGASGILVLPIEKIVP